MIDRPYYLERIKPYIKKPLVKVLTGIRRSGKSSILMMLRDMLAKQFGVPRDHMILINFESMAFAKLNEAQAFYDYIKEQIVDGQMYYLFFDEIQEVEHWEKAVNSFLVDFCVDIYITGSNSRLLSSEFATYLTGRTIQFEVMPLSFREFVDFEIAREPGQSPDLNQSLKRYIAFGGFPTISATSYTGDQVYDILQAIYGDAVLRDVVSRHHLRDANKLEKLTLFMMENIGNRFSSKRITAYLKNQKRSMGTDTIYSYLDFLCGAYILYRAPRYDLRGKEILSTNEKYYMVDHGIKNAVMGYREMALPGILENIVYLELKRRYEQVYVGYDPKWEIDFVAQSGNTRAYFQVTTRMESETTIEREFRPLLAIRDQYPKYVISMDEFWRNESNVNGVKHLKLLDFLMEDSGNRA